MDNKTFISLILLILFTGLYVISVGIVLIDKANEKLAPQIIEVEKIVEIQVPFSLDINDRENGICSDMYRQGFNWGLSQIPLQNSLWDHEDFWAEKKGLVITKEEKAMRLYDYVQSINLENY